MGPLDLWDHQESRLLLDLQGQLVKMEILEILDQRELLNLPVPRVPVDHQETVVSINASVLN